MADGLPHDERTFMAGHAAAAAVNASAPNGTAALRGNGTAAYEQPDPEEIQHAVLAFYLVLFVMFFAQAALVRWRKRHKRSYDLATLVGLWLIPPIISLQLACWRFVAVWVLYSSITGYYLYRCSARKLDKDVPRKVYAFFMVVFRLSVGIGFAGYVLLLLEFTGAGLILIPLLGPGAAVVAIWYGLYFGILTRDCAEVASDRIALSLGTGRRMAVSVRDCGICGGELYPDEPTTAGAAGTAAAAGFGGSGHGHSHGSGQGGGLGNVQLACKHLFHLDCIRGWCIIGKKDTCPTCWEKVDTKSVFADKPWETRNLSWIQMLDMVRYLVVWNPIIFLGLHFIFHWTGMDTPPPHHGHLAANGTLPLNGTALKATAAAAANATVAAANATAAVAGHGTRLLLQALGR
ncbi:RING finger 121 [Chlorella sorokiniana]|uniref:RING finger 121 n=1 Tax=Chlorella sorokiniana TaxID=3076 RepID=A0A2P6TE90_CHLSO|nr:RING finger 121 [Chlorella sorokiniana]|eukprot:PRW20957.1 RING finger 121 [Chlorella sorokiniana]